MVVRPQSGARPGPPGNNVEVGAAAHGENKALWRETGGSFAPKIPVDRGEVVSPYMYM